MFFCMITTPPDSVWPCKVKVPVWLVSVLVVKVPGVPKTWPGCSMGLVFSSVKVVPFGEIRNTREFTICAVVLVLVRVNWNCMGAPSAA